VLTTNETSMMVTREVEVSAGNATLRSLALAMSASLAVGLAVLVAATPAAARPAHVRAGGVVHPTRNWCPTNRTCFARIGWSVYMAERAVGHGRAKDCAGGGGPCRISEQTVILDRPRRLCGHLEFSRLRMFGHVFHAREAPLCAVYYSTAIEARAQAAPGCGSVPYSVVRGYLTARGISCGRARRVFRAVEHAYEKDRLPRSVYATPYFHWSRAFTVATAVGRFSCRYSPHGLAGSEHTMRCRRRTARVSWYTLHG